MNVLCLIIGEVVDESVVFDICVIFEMNFDDCLFEVIVYCVNKLIELLVFDVYLMLI